MIIYLFLFCLTFCHAILDERKYPFQIISNLHFLGRHLDQHMDDAACKDLNLSPKSSLKLNSAGVVEVTVPFKEGASDATIVTSW
jgi:hypothetical protein